MSAASAAVQLILVSRKSQKPRLEPPHDMMADSRGLNATAEFQSRTSAPMMVSATNETTNGEVPPFYNNPISTTAIIIIAVGSSALIMFLIVLGILHFKRRKERSDLVGDLDANHQSEKVTKPFLDRKKYKRPDIIITEPTSDDRTSGNASFLEVYSARSATHVANCALATLEDLEENELISPAVTGHNNSGANHSTGRNQQYSKGGDKHDQRNWDRNGNILVNLADEEVTIDTANEKASSHRAERTQSLSSLGRPSYAYSSQSPYGHSPYGYGIGEVSPSEVNFHSPATTTMGPSDVNPGRGGLP
ncbi:hypothetical protein RvY_08945 [Ramazzottius varieornatus]|uniref:Uncharacterized protein n=1 Tax=Ramazzottius varieornatus TaxID=947166 RepID=A0A1D1V7R7_RAMVA|nr:hypothetical protein RvY_08945 [Ramazzottius varieornatus]